MKISLVNLWSSVGNVLLFRRPIWVSGTKGDALNNEGEEGVSFWNAGHTLHVGLLRMRAEGTVCGWQ